VCHSLEIAGKTWVNFRVQDDRVRVRVGVRVGVRVRVRVRV
jgi:hypothetical protein